MCEIVFRMPKIVRIYENINIIKASKNFGSFSLKSLLIKAICNIVSYIYNYVVII